jgi:hypothetical protein
MIMWKKLFKDLITSKKFLVTIGGVLYSTVGRKLGLTAEQVAEGVAMTAAYVVGQGVADHGKEKAKIEAGK